MQNKANLLDAQMNVSSILTMDYENIANWTLGQSKPNSNPIKPNLRKAQMNISYVKTTNYEQKTMNYANNKQTQFSKRPKMNVNLYVIEDYENETYLQAQKNKPKQSQFHLSPKG